MLKKFFRYCLHIYSDGEKGDVQLKIYNNNKRLKEFFVSDLSEILYGESESQFHPWYQIGGQGVYQCLADTHLL